jgi:hypothetical protein
VRGEAARPAARQREQDAAVAGRAVHAQPQPASQSLAPSSPEGSYLGPLIALGSPAFSHISIV